MKELTEDSGIKLFGKKIALPESSKSIDLPVNSAAGEVTGEESIGGGEDTEKDKLKAENIDVKPEGKSSRTATPESDDNPKTPSIDEESSNSQPKTLKKPDKILPCPRCKSMDTKFCYYNNYNVNQPRHFCKSCQRYWTAGGTMRNMPVGAGRRKNKNPASHCLPISQEAGVHSFPANVLSFGDYSPIPIPIPIYPSPYWNCIPLLPQSILGKHSRNGELIKSNGFKDQKEQKNSILTPKTLRIDDADESAMSSIWATLGIKNENVSRGGLFKAFQSKGQLETKKPPANPTTTAAAAAATSPVLQANPAALSRSLCFQERA